MSSTTLSFLSGTRRRLGNPHSTTDKPERTGHRPFRSKTRSNLSPLLSGEPRPMSNEDSIARLRTPVEVNWPGSSPSSATGFGEWLTFGWTGVSRDASTPPTCCKRFSSDAMKQLDGYVEEPRFSPFVWLRFLTGQRLMILHRTHLGTQKRDAKREISLPWNFYSGGRFRLHVRALRRTAYVSLASRVETRTAGKPSSGIGSNGSH